MRSPTTALLWEIWRRQRLIFSSAMICTAFGRLLQQHDPLRQGSALVDILRMLSFVLVFGGFSYTESTDGRSLGHFPRRLFVFPVSSLRLIAVPVVAGIASVELLYLLWLIPVAANELTRIVFNATLLAALLVGAQAVIWTLERIGPFRLIVVGVLVTLAFWISLLPEASSLWAWRSDIGLTTLLALAGSVLFGGLWIHIDRVRSGGWHGAPPIHRVVVLLMSALPQRRIRRPFASATAAHFWFEWWCSGIVLPLLTTGVLAGVVAPLSWLSRLDADDTVRLLAGTLAVPVLLAIPIGLGFAKPAFWSETLSIPSFTAVRPLTDQDVVATKVKVAMASAAASWALVLTFIATWFGLWADTASVRMIATQVSALHADSALTVPAIAAISAIAGICLTWRFLVSRLWIGLSGHRPWFIASALMLVVAVVAGLAFDATRVPAWLLASQARMNSVVAIAITALAAKCGLAAYSWRRIGQRPAPPYVTFALLAAVSFTLLGLLAIRVARLQFAVAVPRLELFVVVISLLAVPVARLGLASMFLSRNRHR